MTTTTTTDVRARVNDLLGYIASGKILDAMTEFYHDDAAMQENANAPTVGLAATGMVPVCEIQFLGFAHQAMHQIAGQVARLRYRSWGRFDAPITIRAPFGGGVRTPELHSDEIVGHFAAIPGLKVADIFADPYHSAGKIISKPQEIRSGPGIYADGFHYIAEVDSARSDLDLDLSRAGFSAPGFMPGQVG